MLWTRDESRRRDDPEHPRLEICTKCGKEFAHRRAPNECCEECGEDRARWHRDQNSRQVMHRLLQRREFMEILAPSMLVHELEGTPIARWARRERIEKRLAELERRLVTQGPNDRRVRSQVATDAALLHETIDPTEKNQLARAKALLCDVGVQAGQEQSGMRRYAAEAIVLYRTILPKDRDSMYYARLAGALLRFSNACRNGGDTRTAEQTTTAAYHILKEKCDTRDVHVKQLLHQADVRALRLLADGRNEPRLLARQRDEMIALASEINNPLFKLETARELAGYYLGSGDPDSAQRQLEIIEALRRTMPERSLYDAPTLLRPKIEFFLASDKKQDNEEALRLIQQDYMDLYRHNRHAYYTKVLEKWCRRYGGKLGLSMQGLRAPPPTYNSPMLLSLPRGY